MRKLLSLCVVLAACGGSSEPAGSGSDATADVGGIGAADPDVSAGSEDTAAPDTATAQEDATAEDTGGPVGADVAAEDVPPVIEVPPWGVALTPDELDALYIFGITSDPMSALSLLGTAVTGISAVPAVIDFDGATATIRAASDAGKPVPGPAGVIESYPASTLEDGRVLIDLRTTLDPLAVQLYANCTYERSKSAPAADPVYADSLITWPMQETYISTGSCSEGTLPVAKGVNVHFLRRADANPTFEPRAATNDVPFGFFMAGDITGNNGGTLLDRMPLPADASGNGTIKYLVSKDLPEALVPAIDAAFENWNDALEEAAGVRPLSWERATETLIPWDPRYRTITWDKTQTAGAVAPFVSDPRTGEMFATAVILWMGDLQLLVASYLDFLEKHPDAPWVDFALTSLLVGDVAAPTDLGDGSRLPPRVLRRHIVERKPFDLGVVRQMWLSLDKSITPEEMSLQVVAEFLSHELGHNFGLRHNFKGSVDRDAHPPEAPSTTVMDYVVGMGRPGTYDLDAMRYAYGAGPESTKYLYCTDEDVFSDPGCARWDFGHPLVYALELYDSIAEAVPFGQDPQSLQSQSQQQGWNQMFNQLRDFVNSAYEQWDPALAVDTFTEVQGRIVCEGDCQVNPWLRARLVNYMLRTKKGGGGGGGFGGGAPYPALTETQAASLYETLYALVVDNAQPLYLRTSIVDRLSKAQLAGGDDVLTALAAHFGALVEPTADEAAVIDAIEKTGTALP